METEKFLCPHCGKGIEDTDINRWKAQQLGRRTSEKKAASSAENGKKGGRPKICTLDDFSLNAWKDGKMHILQIERDGGNGSNKYNLIICYPGGGQAVAKYQPKKGFFPCNESLILLAEENGFDPIDIRAFRK